MARDISTVNQTNIWGKQADDGFEPQRADLFFVDFTTAQKGMPSAAKIPPIIPHYVRSVSLPEIRTKADPIRRDSIAYNMPSWDDPLDPVKIVFLMDTRANDSSAVIHFLETWMDLTRAGRGNRRDGYYDEDFVVLNSIYRIDFQFAVSVYLVRGAFVNRGGFVDNGLDDASFRRFIAESGTAFRAAKQNTGRTQQGSAPSQVSSSGVTDWALSYNGNHTGSAVGQNMVIHSTYILKQAWLAAYKISDLSYTESSLVTVEATFYVDDIFVKQS